MNERMTELLAEAGAIIQNRPTRTIPENLYGDEIMEKFAELIVQECLDILKDELNNRTLLLSNPPKNGGVYDAAINIRRHFGIK